MPKEYVCELCKKVFTQKGDLTKHSNKKQPCISLEKLKEISKTDDKNSDNKSNLTTIFKYCLDVLRDNEHLTGDKALRTLAHLLDLRLLEPQFGKTIDIDNYEYDFSHIEDEYIENHKMKLLTIARFSKLAEEKEDNIPNNMKYLWDDILSVHPKTKNIFQKGKGFDITNQSTYKKLINKLNTFNFENVEADILGEAYEEVIQDVMIGKTLGQFFTPPKIKKIMVKLIDPQIKDDGTIEKIFDPAMGTGGFLITCIRHLVQKSKAKNINLNWDFISKEGLGGREAEPDTYQLAVSNMMISTGHMFDVLEKGDSIRNPITNKYDIILANPPFGIDGLDYMEITNKLRNEYLPIKSNSAVPLFLQAIIYMLKIGGRCALVLPDGKELFSKTNELVAVREFLMKTCDLKEVIYLPAGVFTHTTIKTCVFYFIKKRNGNEILETNIKISKTTQKETGRDYKFSKTHQTNKINFYEFNPETNVKHHLLEVNIDDLSNNSYSLNYAEYLKEEENENEYEFNDEFELKKLSDVCELINGYAFKSDNFINNGIGLISIKTIQNNIINNNKISEFIEESNKYDKYKVIKNDILIALSGATTGKIGIYISDEYGYLNQRVCKIKIKNNNLLSKYLLYYYILNDLEKEILKNAKGTAQPNISTNDIGKIKILIPSIEKQKEIVSYLDFIYEKCIKTSEEKIEQLKQLNKYCINNQKSYGENQIKNLDEICELNPEGMKTGQFKEINYIDISSVKEGELLEYKNLKDDFPSRAKRIVKQNDILYSTVRPNLKGYTLIEKNIPNCIGSTGFALIRNKEKSILPKYLYYSLTDESITNILISKAKGAQYPAVSATDFEKLKISIPSIEKQKEIINYCENNDMLIKNLEKEIENNKKIAESFMSNIIKKTKNF